MDHNTDSVLGTCPLVHPMKCYICAKPIERDDLTEAFTTRDGRTGVMGKAFMHTGCVPETVRKQVRVFEQIVMEQVTK